MYESLCSILDRLARRGRFAHIRHYSGFNGEEFERDELDHLSDIAGEFGEHSRKPFSMFSASSGTMGSSSPASVHDPEGAATFLTPRSAAVGRGALCDLCDDRGVLQAAPADRFWVGSSQHIRPSAISGVANPGGHHGRLSPKGHEYSCDSVLLRNGSDSGYGKCLQPVA